MSEKQPSTVRSLSAERESAPPQGDVWRWLPRPLSGGRAVVPATMLVAVATAFGMGLARWLPQQSISLVYMLFVVLAAIGFGTWSGVATALLACLAYNFFFIPPIYTFTIADPQELFALFVFLAVALVTGSLAGRMRDVADKAQHRAASLLSLNEFAGRLSGTRDTASILHALAEQCATTVNGHAVILLKRQDDLAAGVSVPPGARLEPVDWQAAQRTLRSGRTTYASAPGWLGARFEFRPLSTLNEAIGVIGLAPFKGPGLSAPEDDSTLQTLIHHAMIAMERTQLEAQGAATRDEVERERIRSALLSSLSHDLKTPLASILGAATSLRELGASMPPETRADLLLAIEEETGRLSQFVANLLDLTRLDTETPDLQRDWLDVTDAAQTAVVRAKRMFPGQQISIAVAPAVPLVRGDAMLFETLCLI